MLLQFSVRSYVIADVPGSSQEACVTISPNPADRPGTELGAVARLISVWTAAATNANRSSPLLQFYSVNILHYEVTDGVGPQVLVD